MMHSMHHSVILLNTNQDDVIINKRETIGNIYFAKRCPRDDILYIVNTFTMALLNETFNFPRFAILNHCDIQRSAQSWIRLTVTNFG